ncbi:DUF4229 domain-containing protein [uncultured Veillonella sp.]|uniref:DUF4229 domain-containing protein n=1 Tax=uncultured Veillonella sp. TaxID=159268 RepID=UPI0025EFB239|nr:DUF4229 domain-containing protein [uncultured Veillonella sp.]MDY3974408.1 DUF4229 domain-containing protein [Veillonella caviae]
MREEQNSYEKTETKVLSEEERQSFDGITIDEDGREQTEHDIKEEKQYYYQQGESIPRVKVYSFTSLGWKGKLILGAVVAAILVVVVFFGGMFMLGAAVLAVAALILGLIKKIFF